MMLLSLILILVLLLTLPATIPKHNAIRIYVCYVAYTTTTVCGSVIIILTAFLVPSKIHLFVPLVIFHLKVVGIDCVVKKRDIMEDMKNSVVVFNHQSIYDLFVILAVFQPIKNYIGVFKKELSKVFIFAQAITAWGNLFLDRSNPKTAMAQLKEHFMKQGKNIVIFPEGTRNLAGIPFLPFKKGAFRIAVEFNAPIVPIVLSPYYFIENGKFGKGKIIISIMEPICTNNLTADDIEVLTERVRQNMQDEYLVLKKELSTEIEVKNHITNLL